VDPDTVFSTVAWMRDSTAFAYRANKHSKADFHVWLYDLEDNTDRPILERSGYWYPIDFNKSGSRLLVGQYISASESYVWEVSLIGEGIRAVTSLEDKWSYGGVGYAQDETKVYLVSDYHSDRNRLVEADVQTGGISALLPQLAQYEIDGATMNKERSLMAVRLNVDGYSKLKLYSLPDFKEQPLPEIPLGLVGNIQFQGNQLLYSLNNARAPGLIYKWPIGQPSVKPVALTEAETRGVDVSEFQMPKLIRYASFDGLEIPAFLYLPPGHQAGTRIPFIVSYHGGPEGQYRPRFAPVYQFFLSRGFGVLAPNVRGSSGYGTRYLEMDNYRNRMKSVRDGVAAAKWLIDQGYSEPRRIAAFGGSYGGFMVVAVITEAPDIFGAACDVVGIVNFKTFLERTKVYRRKLREAEYGPLSDPKFLKSISPIYLVNRVNTPVLIAHGKNDPRVPIQEARQLYDALKKRNKPCELLVFDDEGHGFRKEKNRVVFYTRLVDFFSKYLK